MHDPGPIASAVLAMVGAVLALVAGLASEEPIVIGVGAVSIVGAAWAIYRSAIHELRASSKLEDIIYIERERASRAEERFREAEQRLDECLARQRKLLSEYDLYPKPKE